MNRRTALRHMAMMAGALCGAAAPLAALGQISVTDDLLSGPRNPLAAPWAAWKAAYLTDEGRVVDTLQQGASHSESQGYGLLLAAVFGDDAAFDAIFGWTEANLAIRSDALLAWRWLPSDSVGVPDLNNASDGDLFYAWALMLRGTRIGNAVMMDRARAITGDLVARCVVAAPDGSGRLLFLPAAQGFQHDDRVVVNPSYYMPLAMRQLASAMGTPALAACAADGVALMRDLARQGTMPDWIEIGPEGMVTPANHSDRNGYEALRVPLFLIWSGDGNHAAVAMQAEAYRRATTLRANMTDPGFVTVFDRVSGNVVESSTHVGYGAVAALVDCTTARAIGSAMPFYRTVDQAYYPATLHLMALIAQISAAPECVPL